MSRTIRFRAKRRDSDKWAYGFYLFVNGMGAVLYNDIEGRYIPVNGETLGQYTGMKDRHGNDVYEGDVLASPRRFRNRYEVLFKDGIFFGEGRFNPEGGAAAYFFPCCEIIGNVHDNPALIEKGGAA